MNKKNEPTKEQFIKELQGLEGWQLVLVRWLIKLLIVRERLINLFKSGKHDN
jgi:hypothetical protein